MSYGGNAQPKEKHCSFTAAVASEWFIISSSFSAYDLLEVSMYGVREGYNLSQPVRKLLSSLNSLVQSEMCMDFPSADLHSSPQSLCITVVSSVGT